MTPQDKIIRDAQKTLAELRVEMPGLNPNFATLSAAVGGLAASLQNGGKKDVEEMVALVIASAMRIGLDGDITFQQWRQIKGAEPLQSPMATIS